MKNTTVIVENLDIECLPVFLQQHLQATIDPHHRGLTRGKFASCQTQEG